MVTKVERQLGQLLVDRRLMTKDDLEEFAADAADRGLSLPRLLIDSGRVSEGDVLAAVAENLDVPFIEFGGGFHPDLSAVAMLDAATAQALQALPVGTDEEGRVIVAVADPLNDDKRIQLSRALGGDVRLAVAHKRSLDDAIPRSYELLESLPEEERPAVSPRPFAESLYTDSSDADTDFDVNDLLEDLLRRGGSDLHLTAGSPPQVRINGSLLPLDEYGVLKPAPLRSMIYSILTGRQKQELEEDLELDCSHPLVGRGRFRVNVFFQRGSIGAVMRAIPSDIMTLAELNMPPVVADFAQLKRGLVLVTGPTGSGKSTTLASIIDLINSTRTDHIMTVEDPIEFMHRHKMSIVNQREVGADTLGFTAALKHALRQDPDVILVGEMRDLETIATAITAAETGHLVLATLHTQDAPQSVERIIDVFPSHQQQQVRVQLSGSLQAIVAQQLVPTKDTKGRVAAVEVMVATPAIRNLIREGKVHQIASAIQSGAKYGMQPMDVCLANLVKEEVVAYRVALERSHDVDSFNSLVGEQHRR